MTSVGYLDSRCITAASRGVSPLSFMLPNNSDAGGFCDPSHLQRWWADYRSEIGFDGLKLHELRHTSATLLLGNGVDVKTVQTRLGHAKSPITLDFYSHAIPANDKAAADLMGEIIDNTEPSAQVVKLERKTA